jgi:hypothetical protein
MSGQGAIKDSSPCRVEKSEGVSYKYALSPLILNDQAQNLTKYRTLLYFTEHLKLKSAVMRILLDLKWGQKISFGYSFGYCVRSHHFL